MLLSAIMPVFNAEEYVADAIASILGQTAQNWELVIVDDGSTDRTLQICSGFAAHDQRIRVFEYSHGGTGVARNLCLQHARGDVIVICDADDLCFPERFEVHENHFRRNENLGISSSSANIVFSDPTRIDEMYYTKLSSDNRKIKQRFLMNKMALNNPGSAIGKWVFDKYGWYDVRLLRAQDYGFYRRAATEVDVFCTVVPLIMYRGNTSTSAWPVFWKNREFHWIADQTQHLPPCVKVEDAVAAAVPPPSGWYRSVSYLRYLKSLLNRARSRKEQLENQDRLRVIELLARMEDRRSQFSGELSKDNAPEQDG